MTLIMTNPFCNPPVAKCPALEISDCSEVAIFVKPSFISAQSKYDLLVRHFKPAANYEFPKRSGGRSFQHHWLLKFPWLAYSKQDNGGFSSHVRGRTQRGFVTKENC